MFVCCSVIDGEISFFCLLVDMHLFSWFPLFGSGRIQFKIGGISQWLCHVTFMLLYINSLMQVSFSRLGPIQDFRSWYIFFGPLHYMCKAWTSHSWPPHHSASAKASSKLECWLVLVVDFDPINLPKSLCGLQWCSKFHCVTFHCLLLGLLMLLLRLCMETWKWSTATNCYCQ